MNTLTLRIHALSAQPIAIALTWAAPATAAALALALGDNSLLRSAVLLLLLASATLAAGLLPALAARNRASPTALSSRQAATRTAAAFASADLTLSTTTIWAGGPATPHWFACILVLAVASFLTLQSQTGASDNDLWTDPDAGDRDSQYPGSLP